VPLPSAWVSASVLWFQNEGALTKGAFQATITNATLPEQRTFFGLPGQRNCFYLSPFPSGQGSLELARL